MSLDLSNCSKNRKSIVQQIGLSNNKKLDISNYQPGRIETSIINHKNVHIFCIRNLARGLVLEVPHFVLDRFLSNCSTNFLE